MALLPLLSLLPLLASAQTPLTVVKYSSTPNGFTTPPRGFNSFGLQVNTGAQPNFSFNQSSILTQARALVANSPASLLADGDYYISLDSGWSVGCNGDQYGRIIDDTSKFDISDLAPELHSMGLKLGVYVVPGSFHDDGDKTIEGTSIAIRDTWDGHDNGLCRMDFDDAKDGVQQWHDSVVGLFADWGVDLIKFDYVTPGSPSPGSATLQPNTSGSVIAFHKAIEKVGRPIRLDISWKLERNDSFFDIWEANADSMRLDQDLNAQGGNKLVEWAVVQRAIENYRQFISTVIDDNHLPLTIHPDMDNAFIGNPESVTGVSDAERTTIATHWIAAGANLLSGSDFTNLDDLGKKLLTLPEAWVDVANFTAQYPMQPRNPGTGKNSPQQLQVWIAGPDGSGDAAVVLANYGPDQGQGNFNTSLEGTQNVTATWADLGLSGSYQVRNVWESVDLGTLDSQISAQLGEGESQLLRFQRAS
ncbi:glycoside hydrolase family 27 protein [Zasmidium cellare ATCC 36951]|uniref:alpha-galactosidase n=1 Tax=Zasmidium cellare ATCC 36951 TaxID=1080233 RepID=A0A6A6D669_ZASCE|nr:glycoside hydrolase family 27 protein [Zasmidium cellare ATCC 36951]KAF2173918.1 glycoside hydrolase family 27 protein [Zasmidium cellare ATCC 36951]